MIPYSLPTFKCIANSWSEVYTDLHRGRERESEDRDRHRALARKVQWSVLDCEIPIWPKRFIKYITFVFCAFFVAYLAGSAFKISYEFIILIFFIFRQIYLVCGVCHASCLLHFRIFGWHKVKIPFYLMSGEYKKRETYTQTQTHSRLCLVGGLCWMSRA